MKFTPSAKFLRLASSTFKMIETRCYFRKVTSLAGALNTGTWIDASSKLQGVPEAVAQIEYSLGQFSADSIQLVGKDIAWWAANVFNASSTEYIECKIELRLADDPANIADDIVYYFSGIVYKKSILPSESDDSYSFTVDTADVTADAMLGEFLTTQYYDNLRGGAVLFHIPGVYVVSTNVSGFPLSAGVHTIAYDYNANKPQVRLDSGTYVQLPADGVYLLGNGSDDIADTDQVQIRVYVDGLPRDLKERNEDLIIQTSPSDLPLTWYSGISLRSMLNNIYTKMGITSQSSNILQVNSHDGTDRVSMLEYINDGQSTRGVSLAIVYWSATIIYVANGNNVYLFNSVTSSVTLLTTVTAGDTISKMIYNGRNGHLWILHGSVAAFSYGGHLSRYDVGTSTLQDAVGVPDARYRDLEMFDISYGSSSHEYCLVYPNTDNGSIMRVDGVSMALTTLFNRATLGYAASYGPLWNYAYQGVRGSVLFYRFQTLVSDGTAAHEILFDPSGSTWTDGGRVIAHLQFAHAIGAYDSSTDTVYGYDTVLNKILAYSGVDGGPVEGPTYVYELQATDKVGVMHFGSSKLFFTTVLERYIHTFNGVDNSSMTQFVYADYSSIDAVADRIFGVDTVGRVFQIGATIELFLDYCNFGGRSIKNALTDALIACNCVGTISAAKSAIVYPRSDSDGTPVTSGNSIDVTVANVEDISEDSEYGQAFDIIEIDNGDVKINYNGTAFNVMPASLMERILRIQNTLVPSSVVKDYLKMFYEFFKTPRTLYTFPVLQSLFHIEPMDAANIAFTTTKIKKSANNCPIYSVTYSADTGKMKIGVLV